MDQTSVFVKNKYLKLIVINNSNEYKLVLTGLFDGRMNIVNIDYSFII